MTVAERCSPDCPTLLFSLEAHGSAASLYLGGVLTAVGAQHAVRLCDRLPAQVTALRVDIRAAVILDPDALDVLTLALGRWRAARRGMTRVSARHRATARAR